MKPIPALHLYPVDSSFAPKEIFLGHGPIQIGRKTSNSTEPEWRNGYFDNKTLSRKHALVWEETGKIMIKDTASFNGTYINAQRLSAEEVESQPIELKSGDILEFGVDIVGEDGKTLVHHKVAARVSCVLTPEDFDASSNELA